VAARVPVGHRYMVGSAFFFSVMGLLVKAAGHRLPTWELILGRSASTLAISAGMLGRLGVAPWGRRRGLLVLRGAFGFGAFACFYFALVHLPLADATAIQYTNAVFGGLFAAIFLAERPGGREVVGVAACLAGVLVVARPGFLFGAGAALPLGWVAVGLAGAMMSGAAITCVRSLGRSEHPEVIVFYFVLVSTIGSLPALAVAVWPTPAEWLMLLGIGVTTHLGQSCMTRGLRAERVGSAGAVGYVQILFAAMWGILFFAEMPDAWLVAGTVLIAAGTLLLARRPAAE